jgi:hypothetical protein
MKKNPFRYEEPAKDPENFFGRKEEISSIYHKLSTYNSLCLVGERKVGKTSLFLHLIHPQTLAEYEISSENILTPYLDISACSLYESSDVFYKFLDCISEMTVGKIKDKVKKLLEKENIHFQEFKEIIAKIYDNDQRIVFFLDNFEHISKIRHGDIFTKLRYLAQMYDVTFVISTSRDLDSLFKGKRFTISSFFNIFTRCQLRGLDENASHELITTAFQCEGFNIDSSIIDSIIRLSGTNPFSLKLACWHYFERMIKGHSKFDDTLKNKIQKGLESHHRYNWEHLTKNEQAFLLDIIKNGNSNDSSTESSLERKGYIAKEGTGFNVTSESFREFLQNYL